MSAMRIRLADVGDRNSECQKTTRASSGEKAEMSKETIQSASSVLLLALVLLLPAVSVLLLGSSIP